MKNSNVYISYNGPYTNISTFPHYSSQTIRNIAVPQNSISKNALVEVGLESQCQTLQSAEKRG